MLISNTSWRCGYESNWMDDKVFLTLLSVPILIILTIISDKWPLRLYPSKLTFRLVLNIIDQLYFSENSQSVWIEDLFRVFGTKTGKGTKSSRQLKDLIGELISM